MSSIDEMTQKAEQGDAEAQFALGDAYLQGNGIPTDRDKALYWYTKAAEQGHVKAQSFLGMNHFYHDRGKAIYWCLKAAEQGDVETQGLLGEHYYMDAEPRDYDKAIYWYTKAAEQGDAGAQNCLGCIYHDIRNDKEKGIYWCTKAADQGYATAKENLEKWEQHSGGGGCYVATAVYGSYDCPQVWTLRRYRDFTLAESLFGRAFIRAYYAVSPTLVKWFGKKIWFNHLWRSILDRKIENLRKRGINDTPYADRLWKEEL